MSARTAWDKETGERFVQDESGEWIPAERATLQAQAGRGIASLYGGAKELAGNLFGQDQWVAEAQAAAAERNRLFAGTDIADPWTSMIGRSIPSMAATAPIAPVTLAGQLMANVGGGAALSALDIDQGGSAAQRATAGAAGGFLGDVGGRVVGRVFNSAVGLAQDMLTARGSAANPYARAYEDLGGQTLAYQRMEQGTPAQRTAERFARGSETAINPPTSMRDVFDANDALHRDAVVKAVGLNPGNYNALDQRFMDDALDQFNTRFRDVAATATAGGNIVLDDVYAAKLAKLPEIKELIELGEFGGLKDPTPYITGAEWMTAREAVTEAAANRYQNGRSKAGEKLYGIVDDLDAQIEQYVPNDYLAEYARLREQYRVFRQVEKPNVVNSNGQINTRTMRLNLENKSTGFGRTATRGGDTVNPESAELIALMRAADRAEFKAPTSSGTAENLQLGQQLDSAGDAVAGLAQGNPMQALSWAARLAAPSVVAASQAGSGAAVQGMFNPSVTGQRVGGLLGRGLLDELMYPFVGVDDERRPQ